MHVLRGIWDSITDAAYWFFAPVGYWIVHSLAPWVTRDLPVWLTAAGTLSLAAITMRTVRQNEYELSRAREELSRVRLAQRRDQARRVWADTEGVKPGVGSAGYQRPVLTILVHNASDTPISEVEVTVSVVQLGSNDDENWTLVKKFETIGPRTSPSWSFADNSWGPGPPVIGPGITHGASTRLAFTDSETIRWERDKRQRLREVPPLPE